MNPYLQYMYSYPHKTAYRSLSGISLGDYAPILKGRGHGLYLHLPFCRTKCGYCNLFSVTGQNEEQIDRYLCAVERQSRQYQTVLQTVQTSFSELVIGGGTPLLLTAAQLLRTFRMLEEHFVWDRDRALVIETSPGETTGEKLAVLKEAGVTRLSMGIQSLWDEELRTLRRQHSGKQALEALSLIREYGFSCVNVDFIYGIPGQTVDSLLTSLGQALAFEPEEIFLYPLYVKHGVQLLREGVAVDPESALLQYREAGAYLRAMGFRQDSMRRFVRDACPREYLECGFGTSLALGCGGRSYLGNLHFCSPYAVTREGCLAQIQAFEETKDYTKIIHGMILEEEEERRRYVIRHLLIRPGLFLPGYQEHFGTSALDDFPILKRWEQEAYVCREGVYLTLTEVGLERSDWLGPMLISKGVREKMEEWERIHEGT
ncbi:MAG: coproporphyrinogen III oxidase family protein [Lachnospiraceae bacterium]|nr:coproporphyrinogen III oxidase family protein [Lachnospiraceae bacterium]